jgi:hypothetical protein
MTSSAPLLARYGVRDNHHGLLEWPDPSEPPPELPPLTDRPAGHPSANERWWPAVGCAPVRGWWALWWTLPDESASRAGMVDSRVALWRLEDIGAVDDLRPAMRMLSGEETIPSAPDDLMRAVVELLLSPDADTSSPVVPGLANWPGIIAGLWLRLWPEARKAFSARVALSPPQNGESAAPPCIWGIPPGRLPEWLAAHRKIANTTGGSNPGREVAWFLGGDDQSMDEVLANCGSGLAKLSTLGKIARAAGCLDELRSAPNARNAVDLLRILSGSTLAPSPDRAMDIKNEALLVLRRDFARAPAEVILSLSNLGPALPAESLPKQALRDWIERQIPALPPAESAEFLERLANHQVQAWWRDGVCGTFAEALAEPPLRWAGAALAWLGLEPCPGMLAELLPVAEAVEGRLLAAAIGSGALPGGLPGVRSQAAGRRWSRLHAWTAMREFEPQRAFREQCAFPGEPLPGLTFLTEKLPGAEVVEAAISGLDSRMISLAAKRTCLEPELLRPMDPAQTGWLRLWAEHVEAGGKHWPPGHDPAGTGQALLDAVLAGNEPPGLIAALAADLADTAFRYPGRSELWTKLSSGARTALLPGMADALIRACGNSQAIPAPEHPLIEEAARRDPAKLPVKAMAALLSWDAPLSERDMAWRISNSRQMEWDRRSAALVGQAVASRRWAKAAQALYDRFDSPYSGIPELRPALEACYELLGWWERSCLYFWHGIVGSAVSIEDHQAALVNRVADLGAELCPDGLDGIWERAGGNRKDLKCGYTPAERWREAVRLAKNGGLKGRMLALVETLLKDYQYSDDLQELKRILTSGSHSRRH